MSHQIIFQEELEEARIMLVSPYHQLGYCSQRLNDAASILVSNRSIIAQDFVQVL